MKLAIVGGGPAGFYAASRILSLTRKPVRIDVFDRLWAPHGLVRYGVAPDHPEVKNCTHKFAVTAEDPRFRFFGNVNVGENSPISHTVNLPLESIFSNYTHLLFTTGCTLPNLHPSLPISSHCVPALSLVHWYTQHPAALPPPQLENISHVTMIGNGNVSLDIARILLTSPAVLEKHDVPQPVLDVLYRSSVKHVSIVGRRGLLEAAFTMKELREMINLPEASMVPITSFPPIDSTLTRQQTRVIKLLQDGSKNVYGTTPKTWSLDFFQTPKSLALPVAPSSPATLTLSHTILDPKTRRALPTEQKTTLQTDLVVTSMGFHAESSNPYFDNSLGHLRSVLGRVVSSDGQPVKNVYAAGWAATGAKGVLATTMMNSYAVADAILSDYLPAGEEIITTSTSTATSTMTIGLSVMNENAQLDSIPREVRKGIVNGTVTQYQDWRRTDVEEVRRGASTGKERERIPWEEAQTFISRHNQK